MDMYMMSVLVFTASLAYLHAGFSLARIIGRNRMYSEAKQLIEGKSRAHEVQGYVQALRPRFIHEYLMFGVMLTTAVFLTVFLILIV